MYLTSSALRRLRLCNTAIFQANSNLPFSQSSADSTMLPMLSPSARSVTDQVPIEVHLWRRFRLMNRGNRDASRQKNALRAVLVLLMLAALVVFGGCGLRSHNSTSGQPGQQTTSQPTSSGQNTGSNNSAAQQIQDADQQ